MSTQTEQTATPQQQQGTEYHWIITLELPGRISYTTDGAFTPPAGATRQAAFEWIRTSVHNKHPELRDANVMFFALEPNQL